MDRIKSIKVTPLIRKLNQVFEGSTYRIVSRNTLYVRIETSDGIVGEAFGGDEDIYQQKVVEIANEFLAPRLIGEVLQPVERLWEIMFSTDGLAAPQSKHPYSRHGQPCNSDAGHCND